MYIPAQIIIYLVILLLFIYLKRRKNTSWNTIYRLIGITNTATRFYYYGLLVTILIAGISWGIFKIYPIDIQLLKATTFNNAGIKEVTYATIITIFFKELIFTSIGEEILFRGIVAGYFFQRFKFIKANLIQSLLFLAPHLPLIYLSMDFLPFIGIITSLGWLLGWLRFKSKSIFPGIIVHSLINTSSIVYITVNIL